ncbi:MAG: bis(5'-nucleosyl)-tetraphosphatase (symmetrical) YqeK [Elusimicrobiota bacterium]|jgi:nicotinate-nucleotide adenylyltransferase|nr:bis(5'-nucleosyl)-tetraphosphatase (symmetrical) YqeK [Elusimicrobiota bacterium]
MKILIYGGSFDPAHIGHRALLESALREVKPQKTYIFTARRSPFKQQAKTPFNARQQTAKATLSGLGPDIIFDDFENRQNRTVYAWETIAYIKRLHPRAQVYLLAGSDSLNALTTWKNAQYIFKNSVVVAGARKGFAPQKAPFKYLLLKGRYPLVSSTDIRLDIMQSGQTPKTILPAVAQIIKKQKLYGLNCHAWLQKNLGAARYNHVKHTAAAAVKLARLYNFNAEKAAAAALLHDMAKGLSGAQLTAYAKKNKLKIAAFDEICQHQPELLHAPAAAHMAQKIFGVKDKEILSAIAAHTLGKEDMGALDKILFIADMAGKDRRAKDAARAMKEAQKSLDAGLLAALDIKLTYTLKTRKWIAQTGIKLWNKTILKNN